MLTRELSPDMPTPRQGQKVFQGSFRWSRNTGCQRLRFLGDLEWELLPSIGFFLRQYLGKSGNSQPSVKWFQMVF